MSRTILLLPGDYIGQEIVPEAEKVLRAVDEMFSLDLRLASGLVGGSAFEIHGTPLPDETLKAARAADAILLGAVGGPAYDEVERQNRPERALLRLRQELGLFANLRPAITYPQLANASSLKPELVADLDLLIVRELTGGIYFGEPRGIQTRDDGVREGFNTYRYCEPEIERIARVAFELAQTRQGRLCSVDKANVLEATVLWREIVTELSREYADVELEHMYVDNAAMQLLREPKQFDVIVTGNMFGDILSDAAAMLTGSIGMLPSASLNSDAQGLYEPCHGSAPDIAGRQIANPLATILSAAMLLRRSLDAPQAAQAIEAAVSTVLDEGLRTADISEGHGPSVSTSRMGDAVVAALRTGDQPTHLEELEHETL
ncbi:MAG: 3-isopropylmalate dehydrogenase [Pseudomonadota bacterium]